MGEAHCLTRQTSNSSEDGASIASTNSSILTSSTSLNHRRPTTPRAQTDPASFDSLLTHHTRPRNRSPYSRSHLRSSSGSGSNSSSLSAPPMTRAHSLPTVMNSSGHIALSPSSLPLAAPASPLRSPKRTRSPFRTVEDSYSHSGAPSVCDISEDAELELTPKPFHVQASPIQSSPFSNVYNAPSSNSNAMPRPGRRRPASPLYQMAVPFGATSAPAVRTPTSMPNSPLLGASKFNESFPGFSSHYPSSLTSSSIPSTPTSMRSRSPSISSLETIEDIPDAEAEAIEADRIARLQADAEREQNGEEGPRRSSLDVPGERRVLGFGKRDARKRWSVCGAERRGDLDLETIWED